MNTSTQIHVEYLWEYVFKSIMLELAVLNKRERGEERALRWRRDTKWKWVGDEIPCPYTLGHLYRQWIFTCDLLVGLVSHDTTQVLVWPLLGGDLAHIPHGLPQQCSRQTLQQKGLCQHFSDYNDSPTPTLVRAHEVYGSNLLLKETQLAVSVVQVKSNPTKGVTCK
jgi:hypothetical protein